MPVKNTFVHVAENKDPLRRTQTAPEGLSPIVDCALRTSIQDTVALTCKTESSFDTISVSTRDSMSTRDSVSSMVDDDARTTLIFRNIPRKTNQAQMFDTFAAFHPLVSFFYVPSDFRSGCNLGYGFVDFVSSSAANAFAQEFDGKTYADHNGELKTMAVNYARMQGADLNVEHFRNSTVMLEDESLHPMLFVNGARVVFPEPTRELVRAPVRRRRNQRK